MIFFKLLIYNQLGSTKSLREIGVSYVTESTVLLQLLNDVTYNRSELFPFEESPLNRFIK